MTIDFGMVIAGLGTAAIALLFFYFPWQTFVVDQTRHAGSRWVTELITSRKGGRHPLTTTEMTGRNRALNAARNGQRQRQLLRNGKLADANPFLHLTAHANGCLLYAS